MAQMTVRSTNPNNCRLASDYQTLFASELAPKLSSGASIILSGDPGFADVARRWTEYQAPTFVAVVAVASEQDVQETIRFANVHEIPFLATSGRHGDFTTMKGLRNGIQIDLKKLNMIKIAATGDHATIGGGAINGDIVQVLTVAGKRTVTGICETVGIGGVMLGGGLGFLQGQYGLMIDQLISARLVLAGGSTILVSADSHPDLFWGLKGAGHNFGIITELDYKVYDAKGHETWSYETFTFEGDQLEACFEAVNTLSDTQSPQAIILGFMLMNPEIDPVHPVIYWAVVYDGSASELERYAAPLRELQPRNHHRDTISYPEMPKLFGSDKNAPASQPGSTVLRFGIRLQTYNVQAMRQIYNVFSKKMQEKPALQHSLFALESYSTHAVRAVEAGSTAYPHRDHDILVSPFIIYAPDPSLDAEAREWGEGMRKIALEGTGSKVMHAYVNYSHGTENLGAMYGYESWRLGKLRHLKAKYDPLGRFNFYAPIR